MNTVKTVALMVGLTVLLVFIGGAFGGRQGMMEAQKFPADFDGIIAGAPGLDWTGRAVQAVRIEQAVADETARILQPQRQLLHAKRKHLGWPARA